MKTTLTTISSKMLSLVIAFGLVAAVAVPLQSNAATLYRELQLGMSGSDVSSLQTFLASDPSVYPQGLVTGYFGSLTQAAVRKFQANNGIATVGRVGPQTLVAINAQMSGTVVGTHQTAPIISGQNVTTGSNSATISWNTNESASGLVYYSSSPLVLQEASPGTDVTISGTSVLANTNLSTSHSAAITGLSSNTTYNYVIYTRDNSGNVTVTWPATFRTSN